MLDRPDAGLWAVADGMGGHQAGDVASDMIVESLAAVSAGHSPYGYLRSVREALQGVNQTLICQASASRDVLIGSTVVVLLITEAHYACLWAGDSRAYQWREGVLQQLTKDHSLVQDLVDTGSLQAAEARSHRNAHVITRALGVSDTLDLDFRHGPTVAGDRYLLCSDGLTNLVADTEIEAKLGGANPELAASRLMSLVLERGGSDNVSIVITEVSS